MRRQLNTLYVTTDGAWLRKDGENIVMEVGGECRARMPVHMLERVVCIGRVSVSPPLLGFCSKRGIGICYLTQHGRFLARVEGPVSGNVLLRREQYRRTDDPVSCARVVRNVLAGKLNNQRAVLGRALRDHGEKFAANIQATIAGVRERLRRLIVKLATEESIDVLRGWEGEAAHAYFSVFDHLILVDSPGLRFAGRSRRPPLDPINALLSFLYTLLVHDCRSALESVGLDPAVGFLHRDRPGRPSLALDLVEEFRPVLADRVALSLVNRRQITERDFITDVGGAVTLKDGARKTLLSTYQERKREELEHLFLGESAPIGMFPFVQAQLMARHLRGDIDAYPPFIWK